MTNSSDKYKVFRYYEGLCSSGDFPKEIAKVLSLGVKSSARKDIDGSVIEDSYLLQENNWDIIFPEPDENYKVPYDDEGNRDCTTEEFIRKINNQVEKISDTVILKTRTTEKNITDEEFDDLTVDQSQNSKYLDMYLEIYKPAYIANPETYPLDCERQGIVPKLITRELYENSFKTKAAYEDVFGANTTGVTVTTREDDSYIDYAKHLTEAEKTEYVAALDSIKAAGEGGYVFDSNDLAKVKRENVKLYDFIRNTIGIEPEEYMQLSKLTIEVSSEGTNDDGDELFMIGLKGVMSLKTYKIAKGTTLTLTKSPIEMEDIVPEYRLNGVYIPVPTEYYYNDGTASGETASPTYDPSTGKASFKIQKDLEFIESKQGELVCRYTYNLDKTDSLITDRATLLNNHYVLMRLFDKINDSNNGPLDNTYNSKGEIIKMNSHVSDWAKLSWYKDFEEVMLDYLDEDVSTSTITDGSVFVPIETPGLNSDTKIRYWINTNNDRFSLVVMGNPSLDYQEDRHLISACYCGAIDSFDNSINDTAGNFALFTSSSTEPCATVLNTEKTIIEPLSANADAKAIYEYTAGARVTINSNEITENTFDISLPEGVYFDRTVWPKYIITNVMTGTSTPSDSDFITQADNKPAAIQVKNREFHIEDGKANSLEFSISDTDFNTIMQGGSSYTIGIVAQKYTEKKVITSGVTRDVFGNVVNVTKTQSYGKNTSDGVTSIMMYHTRSKAFYQKHHMLFATTEEYMSKVMYGKSMYTGEYYADRIKVTHGNDGPRGILSDLLVIDSASLYALDELVINKDFEKDKYENEETFVYFPITAPYSPLSDSPNATYGLAIKKGENEPGFTEQSDLLKKTLSQLENAYKSKWKKTETDIFPHDLSTATDIDGNKANIYWQVLDNTAFKVVDGNEVASTYVPLQINIMNTSQYNGDTENVLADASTDSLGTALIEIQKGTTLSDGTVSYVKIAGFAPSQLTDDEGEVVTDGENNTLYEDIYYGVADEPITGVNYGATLVAAINDGSQDPSLPEETFTYAVNGKAYAGQLDASKIPEAKANIATATEVAILNAEPNKYLVLYSAKTKADGSKVISKYANISLSGGSSDPRGLLQFPGKYVITAGANGFVYLRGDAYADKASIISGTAAYNEELVFVCAPLSGYELDKVIVADDDGNVLETLTATDAIAGPDVASEGHGYASGEEYESSHDYLIMKTDNLKTDCRVSVSFKKVAD